MILTEKVLKILVNYKFTESVSRNAINNDITYSHLLKILNLFEKKGLIIKHKPGRISFYECTEKANKLKSTIDQLFIIWNND